jgi:hypothetical protein
MKNKWQKVFKIKDSNLWERLLFILGIVKNDECALKGSTTKGKNNDWDFLLKNSNQNKI